MNATKSIVMMKTNFSYRLGRSLSRIRQGWTRLQNQISAKLAKKGVPAPLAKWLPRLITLLILIGLFFILKPLLSGLAMVLGTLLALLFAAVLLAHRGDPSNVSGEYEDRYVPGDVDDHKQSIHYHPMNYNDDPDPRFED